MRLRCGIHWGSNRNRSSSRNFPFRLVSIQLLVVVVVAIEVPIVVVVLVPAMVVGDVAAVSIPVTVKVALSIVMRLHPVCAGVCRAGPVSLVPLVVAAHWIPVASNPGIAFARAARLNSDNAGRRRRADPHSNGYLREDSSRCQQHQHNQFGFHDSISSSRLPDANSTLVAKRAECAARNARMKVHGRAPAICGSMSPRGQISGACAEAPGSVWARMAWPVSARLAFRMPANIW